MLLLLVFSLIAFLIDNTQAFPHRQLVTNSSNTTTTTTGCSPNEAKNGIICTNLTAYHSTILNETLWVGVDLNSTVNDSTLVVSNSLRIWVSFWQDVDQLSTEFTFNSSTPTNTSLASGTIEIGTFNISTEKLKIPNLALNVSILYNITLVNNNCSAQLPPVNGSFCDSGTIWTTVGLEASGSQWKPPLNISLSLFEPNAAHVASHFNFSGDLNTFCYDLWENVWYKPFWSLNWTTCPFLSSKCHWNIGTWNFTNWNETIVVANQTCFDRSNSSST